jgi:predicted small lipoprotein YifL
MNKLLSVTAALALALTVAACGTSGTPADAPTTTVADGTSSASGADQTDRSAPSAKAAPSVPEGAATGDSSPSPTPKEAAPAVAVDQSTPEAAMTSWLTAMLEGDSAIVCGLMASGETAIAELPAAQGQCAEMIAPMLEQLSAVKEMFGGLRITGATVSGDTASFRSATTKPALAADIIASLKAVRLDGKWYVTEG